VPLFALDNALIFPPAHLAEPDGLLAMGGDLSPERLLLAYRNGIFPWYEEEPVLWWSPDPRFVLFPHELKISRSMKALLNREAFRYTTNRAFREVIHHCKTTKRTGQQGTWITDEVEQAYIRMHELGYAESAEVWQNNSLAGGLYGLKMGKVFFGESMFSLQDNASKYAFIRHTQELQAQGTALVDCQVYTSHLESLGARMISRKKFTALLHELIASPG